MSKILTKDALINAAEAINRSNYYHPLLINDNVFPSEIGKLPVVKYPNRFVRYKYLSDDVKRILTDRGKGWMYFVTEDHRSLSFECKTPQGIIISGKAFRSVEDDDLDKAFKIAAGRLEASLKFYEEML